MTKTLLEHFKSLEDNDWDYYNFGDNLTNPFLRKNCTEKEFKDFIDNYFSSSGKRDGLFQNQRSKEYFQLIENRAFHTVSVFYLGILISKHTHLNKKLDIGEVNKPGYPKFPFIWFLTVLFHDFGMYQERNSKIVQKYKSTQDIYYEFSLKYKLLDAEYKLKIPKSLFGNIEKYFKYRLSDNKVDHGVLGGLYMYSKLIETRIMKKREIEIGTYCGNRLNWDDTLDEQYALASSVLCCHNIWLTYECENKYESYKKHELMTLDKANFKPIKSRDYPLFFLFGLVDTIDPVKAFIKNYSLNEIITMMKLKICKRSIRIVNSGLDEEHFDNYVNHISGNLIGWLELKLIRVELNTILIKF
ncbi:MAG: hypothetical protein IPJ51_11755 [Saprospiraceae bacterium]|nr:hypothetical protein [Saprospiraceae bacterium]